MTWLDYALFAVLVLSIAWGAWRGLVHEMISLGGWIIAFLAANLFAGPASEVITDTIPAEGRVMLGWLAVFVVVLLAASLAGMLLRRFIKTVGLAASDRTLGALFGLARGLLIWLAFALEGLVLWSAARQHGDPAQALVAVRVRRSLALSLTLNHTGRLRSHVRNPRNRRSVARQPAAL
jgi:membrane protein required for colicin V production